MENKERFIPLIAVVLVICLCATGLVGVVGGGAIFQALSGGNQEEVAQDGEPSQEKESGSEKAESTTEDETDGQPDSNNSQTSEASESRRSSGEQVLALPGGDPPTLDPHLSGDATSAVYVVEIYSGLLTYDLDLNLIPDLAASWEVSDDRTVYTFQINEDAKFHNGKPVRAQDFKWSFERACDFRTGSTTADTYLGDIIGCRDKLRGRAESVEGVQVIDDQTLEITIDAPKAYFLDKLTYPTAYVLDRENVERGGRTWTDTPNGTGPFKLESFDLADGIVLAKNENYYRDPRPQLERIHFTFGGGSAMIRYENDELDITPVGINDIERVTDPTNLLNADLEIATELAVFYIGFNVNQPPFDDPKVRQAFNLALDKEKIINVVYKETQTVAQGIVPPDMPAYSNPNLSALNYDPDRALELIAESTYGDVSEFPEITLYTTGAGGSPARITEAVIASYKDVLGVDIAIQQTDWPTFLADISQEENPYQMYQLGWIADYPDPQNFLDILFHTESRQNHTGYSNEELDAILDEAGVEQDPEQRVALYREAEQLIIDEAPWVPLHFGLEYELVKPWVQGYSLTPMVIPKYQYVYISEESP
jgi:ABC-type transport system substrate-binding protein